MLSATTNGEDSGAALTDELTPVGSGQRDMMLEPALLSFATALFAGAAAALATTGAWAAGAVAALVSSSMRARERNSAWASATACCGGAASGLRKAVFSDVDRSGDAARASFSPWPFRYQQWRLVLRSMR